MNADELIRSGLLEAYVLGQASPEEVRLVEGLRASDARVQEELEAIEVMLEQHAKQQSVAPPPALKAAIMGRIGQDKASTTTPVIPIAAAPERRMNWLVAASIGGLVLSAAMNLAATTVSVSP